jgi:hypothetical protein
MGRKKHLPSIVLVSLVASGLVFTLIGLLISRDWGGAFLNIGTELGGAVIVYWLLDLVLGREQSKEKLIANMGSDIRDVAVPAANELRRQGWLLDGSLMGADLRYANLEGAKLHFAVLQDADLRHAVLKDAYLRDTNLQLCDLRSSSLQGASLVRANLQEANLQKAQLQGADLRYADLQGAKMEGARFDNRTKLPDGFDPKAVGAKGDPTASELIDWV